jgi:hypothetical protein
MAHVLEASHRGGGDEGIYRRAGFRENQKTWLSRIRLSGTMNITSISGKRWPAKPRNTRALTILSCAKISGVKPITIE